jgi:hypothetical protein
MPKMATNPTLKRCIYPLKLIKHLKQETSVVPPLKYENKFHNDVVSKTTALNKLFQSVFSPKSPLFLV